MKKIYIAAPFNRAGAASYWAAGAEDEGWEVVSTWFYQPRTDTMSHIKHDTERVLGVAISDLRELASADAVVVMAGGSTSGGKHVETGLALAMGKRVVIVGGGTDYENVFHALPNLTRVRSFGDAMDSLTTVSRPLWMRIYAKIAAFIVPQILLKESN